MAITRRNPNTIHLGGDITHVGDLAVGVETRPGMLVEKYNTAGVWRWKPHATAGGDTERAFALNQSMLNLGVDDVYAIGDLAEVAIGHRGSTFWVQIPSGQNIVFGQVLESNGDGLLKAHASGTKIAKALETKANVTVLTRIRVELI